MRKLLILAALAGLTGCTAPLYGRSNFLKSPGYSDKSLGEGVWEVTFRTQGSDRENRYQMGALYRSAELARQAGFPFFQVVRFQGWTKTQRFAGTPPELGVPIEHIARLTVRGVRTRDEELQCESQSPTDCGTYSTEETLRTLAPKLMQQPTGVQGASPPT
jgi:hypothetical protein